jgi:hypothetical protein
MSFKSLLAVAGVVLLPASSFAAGDIPTRYQGKFPGDAPGSTIAGTYTGKTLTLKGLRAAGKRSARHKAGKASPARERICPLHGWLAP